MYLHDDLRYYSCQHIMYVFHTSSQNKRGNSHSCPSTIVPHVLTNAKQTWVIYPFYGGGSGRKTSVFLVKPKLDKMLKRQKKSNFFMHSHFLQVYALAPNGYHFRKAAIPKRTQF